MSVSAIIVITQFEPLPADGSVREIVFESNDGSVRELAPYVSGQIIMQSLTAISSPFPYSGRQLGHETTDRDDWTDSPAHYPTEILYRHRFGYGRDNQEVFPLSGRDPIEPGQAGSRWGNMDNVHAELLYEREFPLSAEGSVRVFKVFDSATLQEFDLRTASNAYAGLQERAGISSEADLEEFPFLLFALPEPNSKKNPVDTDVFIRLSNFTTVLNSGTITLYIDNQLRPNLEINTFVGGLGGFDVTWHNNQRFDYDAEVLVRWEFSDTSVPANRYEINYPFYTVRDLAKPRIQNLVPSDESINVPINGPLQFELVDFENSVNIDSLILYVNNTRIIDGVNGTIETFEFVNKDGYTVRFTPSESWLYGDLIPVALFVKDTSANENELFFTYSFTTIESTSPRIVRFEPAPCTIGIPTVTDIELDVIDGGHGINKDTIILTVEEIEKGSVIELIPIVHRDE